MVGRGYDVISAKEADLLNQPDPEVYGWAVRNNTILITLDADFADHVIYPIASGRVVLRPKKLTKAQILPLLEIYLAQVPLEDTLWYMSPGETWFIREEP